MWAQFEVDCTRPCRTIGFEAFLPDSKAKAAIESLEDLDSSVRHSFHKWDPIFFHNLLTVIRTLWSFSSSRCWQRSRTDSDPLTCRTSMILSLDLILVHVQSPVQVSPAAPSQNAVLGLFWAYFHRVFASEVSFSSPASAVFSTGLNLRQPQLLRYRRVRYTQWI